MTKLQVEELRNLVKKTLEQNLFESAAFLGERLSSWSCSIEDSVLYANCYYRGNQYRRCLAVLEQKGYLSAAVVADVGKLLLDETAASVEAVNREDVIWKISAIELAAQCLYGLEQYEDCVSLLQPLIQLNNSNKSIPGECTVEKIRALYQPADQTGAGTDVNAMAVVYCILGKCYDRLEHRTRALKALTVALQLDAACIEAAEYLVDRCLLTKATKLSLYRDLSNRNTSGWLLEFYEVLLLGQNPSEVSSSPAPVDSCSASWLARRAEYFFEQQNIGESYRLSRQAYILDPFDERALYVYVAAMVELKLKTELFYLGHELVNSFPRKVVSWYTVGCYYWCCSKFDLAQKHLVKATKLDKRCSKAWLLLGHVMAALEESEQAIAAFRTASRLLPGEHMPLVCMAKELVRSSHLAPALHILASALDLSPDEPGLLNELGVTYLKQGSMDLALQYFGKAVHSVDAGLNKTQLYAQNVAGTSKSATSMAFSSRCSSEIFSNYATALRKCERFEEALYWYDKCMATNPSDANCHASVGFTFHLMQRFDLAVSSYHQALAIQPNLTFCSDMLSRAMEDMSYFPSVLSVDPVSESEACENFQRLSKYGVGINPLNNNDELGRLADASRSFHASLGYAMAQDDSGVSARCAEESYQSVQLSEMVSPGVSVAQSFSRIEGRLSLSPRGSGGFCEGGWRDCSVGDGDFGAFNNSCMTPSDHGGFLNDSFE